MEKLQKYYNLSLIIGATRVLLPMILYANILWHKDSPNCYIVIKARDDVLVVAAAAAVKRWYKGYYCGGGARRCRWYCFASDKAVVAAAVAAVAASCAREDPRGHAPE
jgi:hypothetical protein